MDGNRNQKSFWSTLPGILSASAAGITAISGLIVILVGACDDDGPTSTPTPPAVVETSTPEPTDPFVGNWEYKNASSGDLIQLSVTEVDEGTASVHARVSSVGGVQDLGTKSAEVTDGQMLTTEYFPLDSLTRWRFTATVLASDALGVDVEKCIEFPLFGPRCETNTYRFEKR